MYGKLNNGFSSISCRIQTPSALDNLVRKKVVTLTKRLNRFRLMDFIIVPVVGLLSLIIMGFTVMSFLTTLAPNPTWPILVTTVLTMSGASKDYWEVSHCLWELPDVTLTTMESTPSV